VLVIQGDSGSGKTTALRCALNSLRMEVNIFWLSVHDSMNIKFC